MPVTKQRISQLQGLLKEELSDLSKQYGFQYELEKNQLDGIVLNLNVNTISPEEYTVRPSIIVNKPFASKIKSIVDTDDFTLFHCGHFYIDQKLAQFFQCDQYNECQENKFSFKNPLFLFRIKDENSISILVVRIKEMFNDFIGPFLDQLKTELSLYTFYQRTIIKYEEGLNKYPEKGFLERPLMLDINAYLTFVYLSQLHNDKDSIKNMKLFLNHVGRKNYWLEPTIKILKFFDIDDLVCK